MEIIAMKKTKITGKLPKQRNPIAHMLCTQGQFKNKVFENKKKKIKKFNWRKEVANTERRFQLESSFSFRTNTQTCFDLVLT